jgi:soluble lytic murein transglycosylase-like protein
MPVLLLLAGIVLALWLWLSDGASAPASAPAGSGGGASGGGGGTIADLIRRYSAANGVDYSLANAVAKRESGFNPTAVSKAGAMGIFQLMPGTARDLGVDDPFDAEQNIDGGTRYLSQLLSRYDGDYSKALAAYNWGMGHVDKSVTRYGDSWFQHLPGETSAYLDSILSAVGMG